MMLHKTSQMREYHIQATDGGLGHVDTSPCHGESVVRPGATDIVFNAANAGAAIHYTVHMRGSGTGTGDAGNEYGFSEDANGQFDAPSNENASFLFFDLDAHLDV